MCITKMSHNNGVNNKTRNNNTENKHETKEKIYANTEYKWNNMHLKFCSAKFRMDQKV